MRVPSQDPNRFAARIGIAVALLGFLAIFLGWNGAASSNSITAQFPYLISGGLGGLALVVVGAALIVVETSRAERDRLRDELTELRSALEAPGGEGAAATPAPNGRKRPEAPTGRGPFVAGQTTYHVPSCRLLEGRGELERVDRDQVANRGLIACRVCEPARVG